MMNTCPKCGASRTLRVGRSEAREHPAPIIRRMRRCVGCGELFEPYATKFQLILLDMFALVGLGVSVGRLIVGDTNPSWLGTGVHAVSIVGGLTLVFWAIREHLRRHQCIHRNQ